MSIFRFVRDNPLTSTSWSGVSVVDGQVYYVDIECGAFSVDVTSYMASLGFSQYEESPSDSLSPLAAEILITSTQAGTAYTPVVSDQGTRIKMTSGSSNIITVEPNSTHAFALHSSFLVVQWGVGETSFLEGTGVNIRNPDDHLKLKAQYSEVVMTYMGSDEWLLTGGTKA